MYHQDMQTHSPLTPPTLSSYNPEGAGDKPIPLDSPRSSSLARRDVNWSPSPSPSNIHSLSRRRDGVTPLQSSSRPSIQPQTTRWRRDSSISSTVHGHAAAPVSPRAAAPASPNEHIRQAPAIALGSVDHENARRDSSIRIASTRHGAELIGVEQAAHQHHASMFNGAQNTTISGGVFLFALGNVNYMADEMLGGYRRG
jgi:hypothetical protein